MNINNSLAQSNDAQCCIDYCTNTYQVAGQEVVNHYRCNQPPFSNSDLWRIRRNKRATRVRTNI